MYLFELEFLLGICPGVGLLNHMATLFLFFGVSPMLFSLVAIPIYISTNGKRGFPFLHTLSSMLFVDFLMMTILTSVR